MAYEAEKIHFRPFEEMTKLLDGPLDEEVLEQLKAIYDQIPDPSRPETWINAEGLKVLRRYWVAREGAGNG